MLTATRRFVFDYAHSLPKYPGKCKNVHGHHGILEITVKGNGGISGMFEYGGMVIDFSDLKTIVKGMVIDEFDHKNMNDVLEVPTAERFVNHIQSILYSTFGEDLIRIRFYETPNCWVEWEK